MTETLAASPAEAADQYARWVERSGFAPSTRKLYPARVRAFAAWLEGQGDEYHDALTDEHGRDYAVRDYRHQLLAIDKKAPATVEVALSAIGNFYAEYLHLGKPKVLRQNPSRDDVRSLDSGDLKKVLRAAERSGVRDFALTMLLAGTGLRVMEASALDTDDLFISDRMGEVQVRHGKGGASRKVPLGPDVRAAMRPWLAQRRQITDQELGPLFLSRLGTRLSTRRMQSLMEDLGDAAGVELTPHTLRHTYARRFLDGGGDLASLQKALGHKNLSSTQVYTRPSAASLREFVEGMRIDL